MNKDEIEAEIARIKADREGKRGRWPTGMKERLTELEGILMSEETVVEETEELPAVPSGMVNVEIACDNISIPFGANTKLAFQGEIHAVPESFLEIAGDRVKRA